MGDSDHVLGFRWYHEDALGLVGVFPKWNTAFEFHAAMP